MGPHSPQPFVISPNEIRKYIRSSASVLFLKVSSWYLRIKDPYGDTTEGIHSPQLLSSKTTPELKTARKEKKKEVGNAMAAYEAEHDLQIRELCITALGLYTEMLYAFGLFCS